MLLELFFDLLFFLDFLQSIRFLAGDIWLGGREAEPCFRGWFFYVVCHVIYSGYCVSETVTCYCWLPDLFGLMARTIHRKDDMLINQYYIAFEFPSLQDGCLVYFMSSLRSPSKEPWHILTAVCFSEFCILYYLLRLLLALRTIFDWTFRLPNCRNNQRFRWNLSGCTFFIWKYCECSWLEELRFRTH